MAALFAQVSSWQRFLYSDSKLLYRYKGEVEVPKLGMVDDVLNVATCSEQAVLSNATINSFIAHNKLKLNPSKFMLEKKTDSCYELQVHEDKMKDIGKEKYLTDFFSSDGKHDSSINERILHAYSYLSEIRAPITDMPFGKNIQQIGLMIRDAMLLNGILFNSEAWHSVQLKHLE